MVKSLTVTRNPFLKAACLVAIGSFYIWATVVQPFLRNGMPTGWDTGAYLAWVNSFRVAGISYVQSTSFIQFAGLNLVPDFLLLATTYVTSSMLEGYVLFQVITLSIFFTSAIVLARRFRYSFGYLVLSVTFLASSYAFIRMTRDLYGNLLCVSFLQFGLAMVSDLRDRSSKISSIFLFVSTTFMLFTDVEVGLFGVGVFFLSVLLSVRSNMRVNGFRILTPILGGVVVALLAWLALARDYLSVSTLLYSAPGDADWSTVLLEFGGFVLIPLWGVSLIYVFRELKRSRQRSDLVILASWSIAVGLSIGALLLFHPELVFRVALLLPTYFLLTETVRLAWKMSRRLQLNAGFMRPFSLVILLSISVVLVASSVSTVVYQTSPDHLAPCLGQQDYETLSRISTFLKTNNFNSKDTVFLIYPQARLSAPQLVSAWTNLYDNWIFATIGPHITYYGTLENLTGNVPMKFVSSDELATYRYYSTLFSTQRTSSQVRVMTIPFMYSGNPLAFESLSNPIKGVYTESIDLNHPLPQNFVPSYFATAENGGYFVSATWSLFGHVLESYTPSPSKVANNFNVTFSLYETVGGNYRLDLRMEDYAPSNSPLLVTIDNLALFAFNYYGSLQPRIFSGNVGFLSQGRHIVVLSTFLNMAHNLDLDAVRLSSSSVSTQAVAGAMPSNWQVVDGAGNVSLNFPTENLTTVSGTAGSQSNILGVRDLFGQSQDFSGSKFMVLKMNSTAAEFFSLWVTDTNGSVIRYDSQNYSPGAIILLVFSITTNGYAFISTIPPNFSSVGSIELGVSSTANVGLIFEFTSLSLVSDPIPWGILQ